MRGWFQRHPFITFLIGFAALGGLTWWEAARIEGAHATVAQGWGTGLAVGILASLGLTAAWVVALWATRGRPRPQQRALWSLALILVISFCFCLRSTFPNGSPGAGPSVITTGIEVGEIAYVATYSAYFMVLIIWSAFRLYRRARLSRVA